MENAQPQNGPRNVKIRRIILTAVLVFALIGVIVYVGPGLYHAHRYKKTGDPKYLRVLLGLNLGTYLGLKHLTGDGSFSVAFLRDIDRISGPDVSRNEKRKVMDYWSGRGPFVLHATSGSGPSASGKGAVRRARAERTMRDLEAAWNNLDERIRETALRWLVEKYAATDTARRVVYAALDDPDFPREIAVYKLVELEPPAVDKIFEIVEARERPIGEREVAVMALKKIVSDEIRARLRASAGRIERDELKKIMRETAEMVDHIE